MDRLRIINIFLACIAIIAFLGFTFITEMRPHQVFFNC
jgi:hypothetical protein